MSTDSPIARALSQRGDNRNAKAWADVLATVPMFDGLSQRHLRRIADKATMKRYANGAAIVRAGEPGGLFYVILDGVASVRRPGKRTVKLRPGDFFGELALLDSAPRVATVEAESEVLAMCLSRTSLHRVLESEPKVAIAMLRTLAGRMRATEGGD